MLGRNHGIRQDALSGKLYVSREFVRTIKGGYNDNYLVRSVELCAPTNGISAP
jgi:hypothetical protein